MPKVRASGLPEISSLASLLLPSKHCPRRPSQTCTLRTREARTWAGMHGSWPLPIILHRYVLCLALLQDFGFALLVLTFVD